MRTGQQEPFAKGTAARRGLPFFVRAAVLAAFAAAAAFPLSAEELATGTGAFFDLPSGFTPGDGDGKTRFSFFDPDNGMEFDIRIFEPGRYGSAAPIAADLLAQIGSKGDISSFTYQGRDAVIADLDFVVDAGSRKGYAVFIAGRPTASGSGPSGSPRPEGSYALVVSTDTSRFDSYSELLISCLDAFSIDTTARRYPGPVSQFLLPEPVARKETRTVALPAGSVSLPWSPQEAQEERSLAEREFHVMTMYMKSRTFWVDAWARYYRMVYKESSAQLDTLTAAFASALPADDPTESARRVLAWVQGFHYERDFSGIDFVPPLTAAFERRGDCDSRAMVMAIILERLGIDCVLMVSRDYSHAMLAVDVSGGGQRFRHNGKAYLVAETTASVGIGMMDQAQTDFSRWLGVDLGE
jgi:hypothetical protein